MIAAGMIDHVLLDAYPLQEEEEEKEEGRVAELRQRDGTAMVRVWVWGQARCILVWRCVVVVEAHSEIVQVVAGHGRTTGGGGGVVARQEVECDEALGWR